MTSPDFRAGVLWGIEALRALAERGTELHSAGPRYWADWHNAPEVMGQAEQLSDQQIRDEAALLFSASPGSALAAVYLEGYRACERARVVATPPDPETAAPMRDVLEALADATATLLHTYDYDRVGWESFQHALGAARKLLATPPDPETAARERLGAWIAQRGNNSWCVFVNRYHDSSFEAGLASTRDHVRCGSTPTAALAAALDAAEAAELKKGT